MMNQKTLSLTAVAALLLLVFCASLFGQGTASGNASLPAGPFSFAEPTVRLPAGAPDGTTDIILRSSTQQTAPPTTLKDLDLPRPLAATVTFERMEDSNAPPNTWRYRATVYGLPPATSQQHYALVTYADNKTQPLLYTVTNQPAGNFSWSVSKPPDPWVVSNADGGCTAFTVTTKDAPATDVKVFSTLVEQTTKEAITLDALRLCPVGSQCDGTQPLTIAANVPTSLQLCTTKGFHGKYDGTVVLASRQKPDGDTILQHAQFSSGTAKLIGFLLILLGVALAFVAKVWARARLERNQALVPVAFMRSQLNTLKEALAQLKPAYRNAPVSLNAGIKTLLDDLSEAKLDSQRFLPPRFPNPFGFTVDTAGFKTYLETRNPKVQLLSMLVNEGVVPADREDHGGLTDPQKVLVETAIKKIDAMLNNPTAPTANEVRNVVEKLHSDLTGKPQPEGDFVPTATGSSFESLQVEIETISKAVWVLHGILTALSGLAVLILNNPGYGVPLDYVFAIFWGFGLPTVITQLVPSSATTALNISIART
ncbi:MAG TPA: hypothetical protein VFT44_01555 [Pyrinomonadaceae bacterium]|nr:hypothetical protein [Pyrinomonadaceae bacterium]